MSKADYKSENKEDAFLPESLAKVILARLNSEEAAIQHTRLEREVISKARALFHSYADESQRAKEHGDTTGDLIIAVGALEKFEAQQK